MHVDLRALLSAETNLVLLIFPEDDKKYLDVSALSSAGADFLFFHSSEGERYLDSTLLVLRSSEGGV